MSDLNVKAIREARHLTQRALAALLGVNPSTVWRWENEKPPSGPVEKLLRQLETEASENPPTQEKVA